ncbi:hypothetical protein BpHYR1_031908 [Brachionus plicatilis]|uniref:Uncharacterized protein n=1 Tax=Brachionus plicatilis TaxID=10195 RepID=A0A3M7RA31_BRAPC|nr:hypothetical protein BpHYR1_031908 [Brachionus plicatilis]
MLAVSDFNFSNSHKLASINLSDLLFSVLKSSRINSKFVDLEIFLKIRTINFKNLKELLLFHSLTSDMSIYY